jgi:HEAT repeat protein
MSKEIRALAQQHSAEAIQVLVKLMHSEKASPAARAAAAAHILDRAVGRPEASLSARIEAQPVIDLDRLSAEDRALVAEHARQWGSHLERWLTLAASTDGNNGGAQ